ncbi:nuclear transport factor 2 family protein [Phenylobacterium aquaticum]|uniref:nuclear transport factor 2 family protein n=1 Tax=Phenylobacterium aquaticum TaxID=1763816 RepID=UPI001F5C515A|nr:nuclear transport factor 2 family protein [Phenylobacterium aquaticum]MCI3130934.1 nuclear transport factor 2 family protein [Phenylobacterium aquaticum]
MDRLPKPVAIIAAALLAAPMAASAHDPVAGPAPTAARLDPAAAEAAVVVDAFHAALKAGDTSKAESLLADAVLIFEAGGAERSRSAYAAHHLAADAAFAKLATETLSRRSGGGGGNFAWIASEGAVRPQTDGKTQPRVTTETMILQQTAGVWRIVHVHWSSRTLPTAPR